jgi:hypothetical protein
MASRKSGGIQMNAKTFSKKNAFPNANDSHILNFICTAFRRLKQGVETMQMSSQAQSNEEYTMPCAEALLAGTLALMTGHVQTSCCAHRELMAAKIVSNLSALSDASLLSPRFRALLGSLCQRWQAQGQVAVPSPQATTAPDSSLWHTCPEAVQ